MTEPFAIETLDPRLLTAHPSNFRRHPEAQRTALGESIAEHGWLSAPIWNKRTGHVLDGHARVEMAVSTGEALIPVRVLDVSERQERRILASFDRIGELRERDDAALAALLADLSEDGGLPAGWSDDDLNALLADVSGTGGGLLPGADPDAIPEAVETRCQPRDLWQLGAHRLLCGDSTNAEDVERLMNGKRAPLLATDPPYLVDYHGGNHPSSSYNDPKTKDKQWDDYEEGDSEDFFHRFLAVALAVALAPRPTVYQWHAQKRQALVESAWVANGLLVHQQIIWFKSRPVMAHSHFMWAHEPCFYGWIHGSVPERRPPNNERTVWELANVSDGIHPTQKPAEIFARPIQWHTAPSEVCYEPFAGSGTQIIAAEQLGRACYALEISPQFCDVILARFEQATGQTAERLD